MPKLAIRPSTTGLLSIGKRGFCHALQREITKKLFNLCCDLRPFTRKEKFNLSPLICIAFTQGFRIFQSFGHPTLRSEGKKDV